jgi:hypothetical protein
MNTKMNSSIFSPSGRLFAAGLVAMTILAARLQAQYVSTIISSGLNEPYGVTTDPNNNVYITDAANNRILMYVPSTTNVSTLAGLTGTAGTNNGTGAAALFDQPEGIVYAPARGGLVVVDQVNQQLRFVSLAGAVSNLAGITGSNGFTDGTNLGQAQFTYPTGIAVANDGGTLYIADQGNNAIRMLSYPSNIVSTIATNYQYNSVTYPFHAPAAVAVDNNNNIWVADSLDQVICMISNGVAQGIAGTYRGIGTNDSTTATEARFDLPSGLLWDNPNNRLIISDTDNDTIRALSLTTTQGVTGYAVQTIAGIPHTSGFVNGALGVAEFEQPFGLGTDTIDSGYYVVDQGNNAVRVLQPTEPPPPPQPIPAPTIGYVSFPLVNGTPGAQFNPFTEPISVFHNAVFLAIEQLDGTVQTFMSYGPTGTTIAPPGTNTDFASVFTDEDVGLPADAIPNLNIPTIPDLTLEAISVASGRPSSPEVSAEIQFVTANPNIIGNDAADIVLSNATVGAVMYYTLDGSFPTNDGTDGIGPITSGTTLTLLITSNVTLTVRAFASGFSPSGFVTEPLTVSNFIGNQLTFGFSSGNSSSKFMTAAGRYYYAPVTITELPNTSMYSLQFNLTETNLGAAPPVDPSSWQFESFLRTPITSNGLTLLAPINPGIILSSNTVTNFDYTNPPLINDDLLLVGWIEVLGQTNLYPSLSQDLTEMSEVHDVEFFEQSGQVLCGAYSFPIPPNAALGDQYMIQAGRPSATTYYGEQPVPVFIQTPTNGSLTNGPINSVKDVTVGVASYLVGNAYPFSWLNAGDFGDNDLENIDVIEVFQTAIFHINGVPANSDYFDAMDSSDGTYNNLYDANDADINSIMNGDGQLLVDDVFVTFKRSLDTNLTWWVRTWSNGVESVTPFTNFVSSGVQGEPSSSGQSQALHVSRARRPRSNGTKSSTASTGSVSSGALSQPSNSGQSQVAGNGIHYVAIAADQVNAAGSLSVDVPIRVLGADPVYPIRVLMLNVEIDPLDGSPPITNQIAFSTGANIGVPTMTASQGANDYGAAWLDETVSGVSGTNIIGTLSVNLPANVTSNSAYLVHFDHFSASPNGLADFGTTMQDGLITVGDRSASSWKDGIPDSWRLLWFGTVSNALSAANADPDGDGASNWQEYVAGTNPNSAASVFSFLPGSSLGSSGFSLQWSSVVNKSYTVQSSPTLHPGNWTTAASNILGGALPTTQWTDTNATGQTQSQFYRVLVQ